MSKSRARWGKARPTRENIKDTAGSWRTLFQRSIDGVMTWRSARPGRDAGRSAETGLCGSPVWDGVNNGASEAPFSASRSASTTASTPIAASSVRMGTRADMRGRDDLRGAIHSIPELYKPRVSGHSCHDFQPTRAWSPKLDMGNPTYRQARLSGIGKSFGHRQVRLSGDFTSDDRARRRRPVSRRSARHARFSNLTSASSPSSRTWIRVPSSQRPNPGEGRPFHICMGSARKT